MNIRTLATLLVLAVAAGCGEVPTKEQETGPVFYPALPETPRVQFLTSISKESDLKGEDQMQQFLLGTQVAGMGIKRPFGIAHTKGRIYVADKDERQIIYIDLKEKKIDRIRDMKGGALGEPFGIFITPDGYKYVADAKRGRIAVYNERDEFFRAYGEEGQFRPTDVVVRGNRVYVSDVRDNEVEILDRESGEVVTVLGGEPSAEDGMFYRPSHLSIDSKGHFYVTDSLNFRVEMFEPDGRFIKQIGELGDIPGTFARPKGHASDRDGHLYVTDAAFENIQIFDVASARPLLPFAPYGARGGSYLPADVHIDYDNVAYFADLADPDFEIEYLIYVANQLGDHKINVYGFGKWKGKTAE